MSLREAFKKLGETAADFSSLEVVTLTGKVSALFPETTTTEAIEQSEMVKSIVAIAESTDSKDTHEIKIQKIRKVLDTGKKPSIIDWQGAIGLAKEMKGEVKLAVASKYEIDGDATQFISETDCSEELLKAHEQAVKSGQDTRKAIMDTFRELIQGFVQIAD